MTCRSRRFTRGATPLTNSGSRIRQDLGESTIPQTLASSATIGLAGERRVNILHGAATRGATSMPENRLNSARGRMRYQLRVEDPPMSAPYAALPSENRADTPAKLVFSCPARC